MLKQHYFKSRTNIKLILQRSTTWTVWKLFFPHKQGLFWCFDAAVPAPVLSGDPIAGQGRAIIGICWPSGTCPHEAQWRWTWVDRTLSLSGWRTESLDLQEEEEEEERGVGMHPQQRPSACPWARSEGRREKTRWTAETRSERSGRQTAFENSKEKRILFFKTMNVSNNHSSTAF